MKVLFLGTPEFAVTILNAIHNSNHEIVGVVTTADKPAGRGRKVQESAVKTYATEMGLRIFQPQSLKDEEFLSDLKNLNADVYVVVAFRMLPAVLWSIPKKGTFNLHASLLPDYRGAAPINWALINGESRTGVTTFFIDDQIDTGEILFKKEVDIKPDENVGELHDRLAELGAECVIQTLNAICNNEVKPVSQKTIDEMGLKMAPKLYRENLQIDWNKNLSEIHNFIRGLSPYPGAWTKLNHKGVVKTLKIFKTKKTEISSDAQDRIIVLNDKLYFSASDYLLEILELQMEGKAKMSSQDFLRGNQMSEYSVEP